jgi:O-antigen/teichoic acid export membrane protein
MNKLRPAPRRVAVTLSDQGLVSLSSFLTAALVAKATTPNDYGIFTLLLATSLIVSNVTASLITSPYKVLGVSEQAHEPDQSYIAHYVLLVPVAALLSAAGGVAVSLLERLEPVIVVLFVAWTVLLGHQELLRTHYLVTFRYGALLRTDAITHVTRLLVLGLIVVTAIQGLQWPLIAIVLGFLIGVAPSLRVARNVSVESLQVRLLASRNWTFGRWILLETILAAASVQLYVYLTAAYLDLETAGGLGAVQAVVNVANVLMLGVVNYAEPQARAVLLREGAQAWARKIGTIGGWLFVAVLALMIALSLQGHLVLSGVFGSTYAQWSSLFPPLGLAAALASVNTMFSALFRTAEMPYVGLTARAVSAVVSAAAAVPLISAFGVMGAVSGIALSQVCWTLTYAAYFRSRRLEIMNAAAAIASRQMGGQRVGSHDAPSSRV